MPSIVPSSGAPMEKKIDLPLPSGSSQARSCRAGYTGACEPAVGTWRDQWKAMEGFGWKSCLPLPLHTRYAHSVSSLSPAQWGGEDGSPWGSEPGPWPPHLSKPPLRAGLAVPQDCGWLVGGGGLLADLYLITMLSPVEHACPLGSWENNLSHS